MKSVDFCTHSCWKLIAFVHCTRLASHRVTDGNGIFDIGKFVVSITDTVGLVTYRFQICMDKYTVPVKASRQRKHHSSLLKTATQCETREIPTSNLKNMLNIKFKGNFLYYTINGTRQLVAGTAVFKMLILKIEKLLRILNMTYGNN